MDDLIKTLKAQLYDRVSSPMMFSFCVSWVVWNYKFILILFSGMSYADKQLAIELLPLSWQYGWAYWLIVGAIGPCLTASIYIFLMPLPERVVYRYTQQRIANLKRIQQTIEDVTPITQEEATKLRRALREGARFLEQAQTEHDVIVARFKAEATQYEKAISEANSELHQRERELQEDISELAKRSDAAELKCQELEEDNRRTKALNVDLKRHLTKLEEQLREFKLKAQSTTRHVKGLEATLEGLRKASGIRSPETELAYGLNIDQLTILNDIVRSASPAGLDVSELSKHDSEYVTQLEKHGFVERRGNSVIATKKGREYWEQVMKLG